MGAACGGATLLSPRGEGAALDIRQGEEGGCGEQDSGTKAQFLAFAKIKGDGR